MKESQIPYERVYAKNRELTPEEKIAQEKFRSFLEHIRIRATDHFVYPPEILTVDEITIATVGNFSASVGKPKSRKTFNVCAIVAALLSGKKVLNYRAKLPDGKNKVLYVDTEQSRVHCHKVLDRILRLSGLPTDHDTRHLDFLMLREFTPCERRNIIDMALEDEPSIGFVVIDGIRDLISDINSSGESVDIINDLMRWTNVYNIHIHTVLHLNKSDDNTRGHIGTELNNKAETVLKVVKNAYAPGISEVRPMITREKEFDSFAFQIGKDGLPETVKDFDSAEQEKLSLDSITATMHRKALDAVFKDGKALAYGELLELLKQEYGLLGYKRARTSFVALIKLLTNVGVLTKQDKRYSYHPDFINKIKE
ncbi:MAG: AAA family ATPase [Bacteroides sp.]|nr:AAA family ATPase [Roseburia sp.]MCM1346297.1 AAA family ATPase [Bacteroides sp.]MCM1420814.1 AAA family ATPase [Bacteroides sp.]